MNCPNCNHPVKETDESCSNCGFNLKKFRSEFFSKNRSQTEGVSARTTKTRREALAKNYQPKKPNSTIEAMIKWIKVNSMIVFCVGVLLLILMSISRPLGWFTFLALMIWLFIVCDKNQNPEQYFADKRLTQKVNQVSSNVVNEIQDKESKVREYRRRKTPEHEENLSRKSHTTAQWGLVLMALLSLIVVFFGPFSAASSGSFHKHSISTTLLSIAGMDGKYSLIGYSLWVIIVAVPIAIIVVTVKNKKHNQQIAFILSLAETIVLFIYAFELIFLNAGHKLGITTTVANNLKLHQMLENAISFGISSYLLFISSILTTILASKSLQWRKEK
ncbi:zinc ribbon domain-containing protein [Lactobacillus sp. PV037]|uniref:zinc ribbon domain-containing protein n=1 Tax=Lactobacillus sp. PV037 TaxID=2594496 RepID=UPI00223F2DAB|nr:zinc ribbon domain-containing protein [Lactobacillus sp. PV037]QNQ83162.1 zinc ribbon domain-containing protein [Lactobacillus sp. PV037]